MGALATFSMGLMVQGKLRDSSDLDDLRERIEAAYDAFEPFAEYFAEDDRKSNIDKIMKATNEEINEYARIDRCGVCMQTKPWCVECFYHLLQCVVHDVPEVAEDLSPLVYDWMERNEDSEDFTTIYQNIADSYHKYDEESDLEEGYNFDDLVHGDPEEDSDSDE